MLVAGASAYPRVIDFEIMGKIAAEVGAQFVVDMAHIAGLVAAGLHPSPIPHATYTTSTTHKTLRGPRGGMILVGGTAGRTTSLPPIDQGRQFAHFPRHSGRPAHARDRGQSRVLRRSAHSGVQTYQKQVIANAKTLAEALMGLGFKLVTDGTDNHLMLVDLTATGDGSVTGKDAEAWLDMAGITVNKNTIPNEKRSPFVTSGIRIGVPAITTRGMGGSEMKQIAKWIDEALQARGDGAKLEKIRGQVRELCKRFPLYH